MVTQKGKSGKFIIYLPFQRPTPSTTPPRVGAVAAIKNYRAISANSSLTFHRGKNQQPPLVQICDPCHISETIRPYYYLYYAKMAAQY